MVVNSIRSRLFLVTVLAGLVPLGLVMLIVNSYFSQRIVSTELHTMERMTREVSRQVDSVFRQAVRQLADLPTNVQLTEFDQQPDKLQVELERLAEVHEIFTEISLYDKTGLAIATTSPSGVSLEYTDWFKRALEGKICASRPLADNLREGLHFSLYFPVPDPQRQVKVIKATLPFHDVWELMDDVQLSDGNRMFILDRYGNIVAGHGAKDLLQKLDPELPASRWIDPPTGKYVKDGDTFYFASTVIEPEVMLQHDRLTLIWLKPLSQVTGIVKEVRMFLLGLGIVIVIFGWVLIWPITRDIGNSLETTSAAAQRVSHGDLDSRLSETGFVEIRRLASAFNQMVQKVKHHREELSRANEELIQSAKMKDEFMAGMSHELRTPLNAVIGLSETLQDGLFGKLNRAQKESLATIHSSGQHLLDLITDILDVAKAGSSELQLDQKELNLRQICEEAISIISVETSNLNLEIQSELEESLPVMGDRRRLRQVLLNLLSNAIKFTDANKAIGVRGRIDEKQNCVEITVWDEGIGISEEEIDQLFQPFHQVDTRLSRRAEGIGMGLTLVKELLNLHEGSIEVNSKLGEGSEFTIRIPALRSAKNALKDTNTTPDILKTKSSRKHDILVVEDNDTNYRIVSSILKKKGYGVRWAKSGIEALDMYESRKPELILMDIQMPEMDGLEAVRILRGEKVQTDIPIFAVTALSLDDDREIAIEAGFDEYFTKPIDFPTLLGSMDEALTSPVAELC